MAIKQPWRSDVTLDLKFMTQTTYALMFVWTVLVFLDQIIKKEERKKKEEPTYLY